MMGLQKLYLVKSDDSNRNFRKRKDARQFQKKYGGVIHKITMIDNFIVERVM